ncbi:hypothetical protein ACFL1M_04480 [Patescibacteria group bacterium]
MLQLFESILGKTLNQIRGDYNLFSRAEIENFIISQKLESVIRERRAEEISRSIVYMLSSGHSSFETQRWLGQQQVEFLKEIDFGVYERGLRDGYVMLACGAIAFEDGAINEAFGGFDCPSCTSFIPFGSGDNCPHCGYTKHEHVSKTGESCD